MGVAFFIVHNGKYSAGPGSGEMALLFLVAFTVLLLVGPGRISLDKFIGK
jgi:putative oxidoreductase